MPMRHWKEPHSQGVYDHPAAMPPPPRPRESNDIQMRVRMLEEHLQFNHHDKVRSEQDSRCRARDLLTAVMEEREERMAITQRLREDMEPLQAYMLRRAHRAELMTELASWSGYVWKPALIALLVLGSIKGWVPPEQAKMFGGWLGLPG